MRLRLKFVISFVALLVPVVLLLVRGPGPNQEPSVEPYFLWHNWLYMAAPQIIALVVAGVHEPSRRSFLVPALTASAVLVVLFQCWIWFDVPSREGSLAWVLYIPAWVIVLAAVFGVAMLRRRTRVEL